MPVFPCRGVYVRELCINRLLQEEAVEYKVVKKEEWESLREEFEDKPCYIVVDDGEMKIYPGEYPPESCIRYDEALMIATKILDLLPYGKVVIDNAIHKRGKLEAVDFVLDIVLKAVGRI